MLSAYVPTGTSLEQKIIEPGQDVPEDAVLDLDLVSGTSPLTDMVVELRARHRCPDPRGDAGDRGTPARSRHVEQRRAPHDRDADVRIGHRRPAHHRLSASTPGRRTGRPDWRATPTSRSRSRSSPAISSRGRAR